MASQLKFLQLGNKSTEVGDRNKYQCLINNLILLGELSAIPKQ
ncbi:MAG TPA: hypothetical protein V6D33_14955 [Cyanophyceae cyanobacterium]